MKTRLQIPLFTFFLTLLCLGLTSDGWGQQTFFPLSSGNYSQDFSNIAGWTNNYAAGVGAENWRVATSVPTSTGTNFSVFTTTTAGGVQKGTLTIVFLATGTNAGATDLLMNFTGRNAGNLSFDYEKIVNSASTTPRSSDLKVQYSLDNGSTFTDFSGYSIPRILNNTTPESGTVNIALPSALNNQSQVVIRFYFWNNGQTGGSGNRPKWGVDNVNITSSQTGAVTLNPSPDNISGLNYTEGNGPSNEGSFVLSGNNLDGSDVILTVPAPFSIRETSGSGFGNTITLANYIGDNTTIFVRLNAGQPIGEYPGVISVSGGGTSTSVTLNGEVTPAPPANDLCANSIALTVNGGIVNGTLEGATFSSPFDKPDVWYTITPPYNETYTITLTDFSGDADLYLYNQGSACPTTTATIGSSDSTGPIEEIVIALTSGITYYIQVEAFDAAAENTFNIEVTAPPAPDPCEVPVAQPTMLVFDTVTNNSISGSFTASSADGYLVVISESSTLSENPADQTNYAAGNTLGNGTVVQSSAATTFTAAGLNALTQYYFFVFAYNNQCLGGPLYLTANPLTGNETTLEGPCLEEDFSSPNTPTGWVDSGVSYTQVSGVAGITATNGFLTTRAIAYPTSLTFDLSRTNNINPKTLLVQVSTTNQNSGFITIATYDHNNTTANGTTAVSLDLSAFVNEEEVYIRFEKISDTTSPWRIDNVVVLCNAPSADFTYENDVWSPSDPVLNAGPNQSIFIVNGNAVISADFVIGDITVASGAILTIENVLKSNGTILNNGSLVFKSTSITNTAQLDTFTGTISGNGSVTLERFIPARRAFRFLSSAVTTSGTINANWQEGQNNIGVVFPDDNQDNVPGFGTHITGSTTGANGFDATLSGNPSLFTLNNSVQAWEAVTNTDVNTIIAGTPYRILVRGDRSIDLTSNTATPTNTILRTTGTLHTGLFTTSGFSQVENEFNFFGNPYPATVNINQVIGASTNVNPAFYYVWDPNLSTRGAYVTVTLPEGTNPSGSQVNQFLQPGQAAFVTTLANGASNLQFLESHKNVTAPLTTVFNVENNIDLRLYTAASFAAGSTPSDGLRFMFGEELTNVITSMDAPKFFNQDENLASSNDDRLWSIESRFTPQIGEVLPLFTNQYRSTEYVYEAELNNITGVTAYLRDSFSGEDVILNNDDTTIYAFTIDAGNPDSSASDRFQIVFEEEVLSTNDNPFGNGFVLYPNPVQNENFFIATSGLKGQSVTIEIYSMLGQLLVSEIKDVATNGRVSVAVPKLPSGVFTVTLTAKDGSRFTTKLLNQ